MTYSKISLFVKTLVLGLLLMSFTAGNSESPIHFDLKTESTEVKEDTPFWVALDVEIDKGWHLYWKNPGEAGIAPQINWTLPEGFKVEAVEWPVPHKYGFGGVETYGYEEKTILLSKILPPPTLKTGDTVKIAVELQYVVCNDETCQPGSERSEKELRVSDLSPTPTAHLTSYFEGARAKIPAPAKHVKTHRKADIFESLVQAEGFDKEALQEAQFFPNEPTAAHFSITEGVDGLVAFHIPEDSFHEPLKGVLVVNGKGYEVHVPVPDLNREIASSDIQIKERLSVPPSDEVSSTGLAIVFAFLGGMILNLMPCVLPVVSLKVLSFVKMAGSSRSAMLRQGLSFALGVILSFWALAGALLVLKSYGENVGWGFQLQDPLFVALFAAVMLIMALSLFGVFELGSSMASWAGQKEQSSRKKASTLGSFFSGVLATAVATPCTGPFLGSAIGYAFTRPAYETLIIFTALGMGMAAPYILLSAFPKLSRFIPKPGEWMETLKQFMGFLMMLSVLWLTWVFMSQTSANAVIILLAAYLLIAFASWIYGKWSIPTKARKIRTVSSFVVLVTLMGAFKTASFASGMSDLQAEPVKTETSGDVYEWENFSPERVKALREQGTPVFIDFTAKWCLICQTNHLVLVNSEIEDKMNEMGVVRMKADWTKKDPVITEELKKFGRSGVPLYLLYGKDPDDEPQILPQVLTPDTIKAALNKIEEK